MRVKPNTLLIVLRYNNYKHNSFLDCHKRIIQRNGHVWMLKIGKMIPDSKLDSVTADSGFVVLKAPKVDGGNYFCACVTDAYNGPCRPDMVYPSYYNEMVNDENLWNVDSLCGSWLQIQKIFEIPHQVIDKFHLVSNGKKVEEVLLSSRTSVTYVNCYEPLEL